MIWHSLNPFKYGTHNNECVEKILKSDFAAVFKPMREVRLSAGNEDLITRFPALWLIFDLKALPGIPIQTQANMLAIELPRRCNRLSQANPTRVSRISEALATTHPYRHLQSSAKQCEGEGIIWVAGCNNQTDIQTRVELMVKRMWKWKHERLMKTSSSSSVFFTLIASSRIEKTERNFETHSLIEESVLISSASLHFHSPALSHTLPHQTWHHFSSWLHCVFQFSFRCIMMHWGEKEVKQHFVRLRQSDSK